MRRKVSRHDTATSKHPKQLIARAPANRRASFIAEAHTTREQMLRTGMGYEADEVHAYLKARIAGKNPAKPQAKPWRSQSGKDHS